MWRFGRTSKSRVDIQLRVCNHAEKSDVQSAACRRNRFNGTHKTCHRLDWNHVPLGILSPCPRDFIASIKSTFHKCLLELIIYLSWLAVFLLHLRLVDVVSLGVLLLNFIPIFRPPSKDGRQNQADCNSPP